MHTTSRGYYVRTININRNNQLSKHFFAGVSKNKVPISKKIGMLLALLNTIGRSLSLETALGAGYISY